MSSYSFSLRPFERRRLWKAAGIGAALCVFPPLVVLLSLDGPKLLEHFQKVPVGLLGLCLSMVLGAWLCHSLRVLIMVRSLGYPCSWAYAFGTALAMEFGVAATPGGVGGATLKAAFLKKRGMPVGESLGLIATDLLIDMVFFMATGAAGFWAAFTDPRWQKMWASVTLRRVPEGLWGGVAVVGAAVLLSLLWVKKSRSDRSGLMEEVPGSMDSPPGEGPWGKTLEALRLGCRVAPRLFRRHGNAVFLCLLLSMGQGVCRFGILPLLVRSFHDDFNLLPLIPLQAFLWAMSLALVTPGGGGGVEILSLVFLRALLPAEEATVVVFLWRFFTLHLNWLVGSLALFGLFPKAHE
ncbi:lysylphosphatidylglycerol synthase transmembrane domain-containing protein [Desulfosoma sp.]